MKITTPEQQRQQAIEQLKKEMIRLTEENNKLQKRVSELEWDVKSLKR